MNGQSNQQPKAQAETLPVESDSTFCGVKVRPLTEKLCNALFLDLPLSTPCCQDFGVNSPQHYGALKEVLLGDPIPSEPNDDCDDVDEDLQTKLNLRKRVRELDQALGNGSKLNALVEKYAPAYAKVVRFRTIWDEMREIEEALSGGKGDKPAKGVTSNIGLVC